VRPVPWEPGVAHVIADLYNPDGSPSEESPRPVLKRVVEKFAELGMRPMVGPELEFYVLEADPTSPQGWRRYGEGAGNVYVAGLKGDPENTLLASLRSLAAYDIDVVAANHEFSSGQFEINLWHSEALDAADRAFRLKTGVQELSRRAGTMATFMAKPFNDEGGSGFHIHFSTVDDPADHAAGYRHRRVRRGERRGRRRRAAGAQDHAPAGRRRRALSKRVGHLRPTRCEPGTTGCR
jgi:glutamine synthetase